MSTSTTDTVATNFPVFGGQVTVSDEGVLIERDGLNERLDAVDTVKLLDVLREHERALRQSAKEQEHLIAWENAAEVVIQLTRKGVTVRTVQPVFRGATEVLIQIDDPAAFYAAAAGIPVDATDMDTYISLSAPVQPGVVLAAVEVK